MARFSWITLQVALLVSLQLDGLWACDRPSSCNSPTSSFHWGYGTSDGPSVWGAHFCYCKSDRSSNTFQSPVNITNTQQADMSEALTMVFASDSDLANAQVKGINNGHTFQVEITPSGSDPFVKVSGGGLGNTYNFLQLHFHWGEVDGQGSEHVVDGQAYDLEMHVVTMRSDLSSVAEALAEEDGLAVFGYLFSDADGSSEVLELDVIDSLVDNVPHAGNETEVTMDAAKFKDLVNQEFKKFYRYEGSLTTPGCFESVTWTVNQEIFKPSSTTIPKLRNLQDDHDHDLEDNFRPPQPIGCRTIMEYDVNASSD